MVHYKNIAVCQCTNRAQTRMIISDICNYEYCIKYILYTLQCIELKNYCKLYRNAINVLGWAGGAVRPQLIYCFTQRAECHRMWVIEHNFPFAIYDIWLQVKLTGDGFSLLYQIWSPGEMCCLKVTQIRHPYKNIRCVLKLQVPAKDVRLQKHTSNWNSFWEETLQIGVLCILDLRLPSGEMFQGHGKGFNLQMLCIQFSDFICSLPFPLHNSVLNICFINIAYMI